MNGEQPLGPISYAYADFEASFANRIDSGPLRDWRRLTTERLSPQRHGDWARWSATLDALPDVSRSRPILDRDAVGADLGAQVEQRRLIETQLRQLHPWRKGPYQLNDIHIDTEWRSDLKWRRLADHVQPLAGRTVLDVGCGNGYHAWRMRGAGARAVLGIDPTLLSVAQFIAIKWLIGAEPVFVLPLGIEDLPRDLAAFDTIFSMGVFYHRRSPLDHLLELRGLLRSGGELVLETLVIDGADGQVLVPEGRYARMRNVWFIPSVPTLLSWLRRCGFGHARCIDVTTTTGEEQRATDWMRFESLADCLDPNDPSRTVEGLPAPKRAIVLAECP